MNKKSGQDVIGFELERLRRQVGIERAVDSLYS